MYQYRQGLRLGDAMKERFIWDRSFGTLRGESIGGAERLAYAAVSAAIPPLLLFRIVRRAISKGRIGAVLKALPPPLLLTAAWACGEFTGYVKGRSAAAPAETVQA
jgi:hypothetical protein